MPDDHRIVVSCFGRSGDDHYARAFENLGLLEFYALGTRRGARGVPPERTRLQPIFGLFNFIFGKTLPTYQGESLRFRTFGLFDLWTQTLLKPGQHFFTAYAFANGAMRKAKRLGGTVFLDAWTSHPAEFWELLSEEQARWKSKYPPVSRYYQDRALDSVTAADYIFTSSTFVRQTFLKRGFDPNRLLFSPYPVDLSMYRPPEEERPANRPFTILHVGGLSLRKGAPYLFEAFRRIRKEVPNAVLKVKRTLRNDAMEVLRQNADLPVEWSDALDLPNHVRRYQTADLLLFPSVEDGFAFVVAEALACGVPVITTTNTGASDLIRPGINGEVVPIRDSRALAEAALKWWERIRKGERAGGYEDLKDRLSPEKFEENLMGHLEKLGIRSRRDRPA